MRRLAILLAMIPAGCASGPQLDNPALVGLDPSIAVENPVYVPFRATAYGTVFEKVLDVVDDYFEIANSNRYSGQIETFPKIAPGLGQPWKTGNPGLDNRLLATAQTYRHRAFILIQPADDEGFFVQVTVFKELEDLPRPNRSTAGSASFRSDITVDRQHEVIDPTIPEIGWIPKGRDLAFEQLILQRLRRCM